jgi:hypothetical protein
MGFCAMPAAGTCASQHRLIAYDIEDACWRARMGSFGSRDSAAVSTVNIRGDPPRRYRPCAQLYMCAVRICVRARDSALTPHGVFARAVRWCSRVRACVCVRPRARARACASVCVCVPSRGTAGTGGIYRSARRWPRVLFVCESSVGP